MANDRIINPDTLRHLRGLRELRGGSAVGMDAGEMDAINKIANVQEAQTALAKQQLAANARQMEANERAQELGIAQWGLVYAKELLAWAVQAKDGAVEDAARVVVLGALEALAPEEESRLSVKVPEAVLGALEAEPEAEVIPGGFVQFAPDEQDA